MIIVNNKSTKNTTNVVFPCKTSSKSVNNKDIAKGSLIYYVRKIFLKTNISYPTIRTGGKKC